MKKNDESDSFLLKEFNKDQCMIIKGSFRKERKKVSKRKIAYCEHSNIFLIIKLSRDFLQKETQADMELSMPIFIDALHITEQSIHKS